MGILDYLTYLLRNQYAGQEVIVKTGHGTTDWFQCGRPGINPWVGKIPRRREWLLIPVFWPE